MSDVLEEGAMEYVRSVPEVAAVLEGADYVDVHSVTSARSLRSFVGACLSYMPDWMRFLYRIRAVFVRLLGMRQEGIPADATVRAQDVSMTPGDKVAFLTVARARDEVCWIGEVVDRHLAAQLGIVAEEPKELEEQGSGRRRYHCITVVRYRHWTGPVYFTVIRPFHHLVVRAMLRHAAQGDAERGQG